MKLNKIHNDKLEIFKIDDFTCEVSSFSSISLKKYTRFFYF